MVNKKLQKASHNAGNAMVEFAILLKKANPDTPQQNREILIETAISAWVRAGGSH